MSGRSQKPRNFTESKIRIIGGQWRGRKLSVGCENGLRPTGDRLRETLFNWLMGDIQGARVLDLFAGTGALGLEALSRGAQSAKFLETNRATASKLRENLNLLQVDPASVIDMDSIVWLKQQEPPANKTSERLNSSGDKAFDIVFIDPPFELNLWDTCIESLLNTRFVGNNSLIYVEKPKTTSIHIPSSFIQLKSKNIGAINAALYQIAYSTQTEEPD